MEYVWGKPELRKEMKVRTIKPHVYKFFEVQIINKEIHETLYYLGQEENLEYTFDVLNQYQFNEDEYSVDTDDEE